MNQTEIASTKWCSILLAGALLSCTGRVYLGDADARVGPDGSPRDAVSSGPDARADASPPPFDAAPQPDAASLPDAAPTPDSASIPDAAVTWNAPDFTLEDLNPNSPSYQQNRTLSDNLGKVMVIYFASYT